MARLVADPVRVLPEQRDILEQLMRTRSTSQQLALRARMILQVADGVAVRAVARKLEVWPKTVRYWCKRWRGATRAAGRRTAGGCATIGSAGDVYGRADLRGRRDDVRAAGGQRSADQPMEPAGDGRRSDATRHHPAGFAALGGAFFKKEADLQPHRVRHWLTPKPDPAFDAKCADICEVYRAAAGSDQTHRTVSIDEMTGIQALERIAPGLPMAPGKVERREFEYRRHGTQTLIAAFDVSTGKVEGVVGDTRTEKDFARFLRSLLSSAAPNTRWHIVCDNLNIHLSECVVRLVARHCGLKDKLGVKANPACWPPRRPGRRSCAGATIASPSSFIAPACFLAQSDRDLVLHLGTKATPPRQLHHEATLAHQDRAVHRLLQRNHGKALPMDHDRKPLAA